MSLYPRASSHKSHEARTWLWLTDCERWGSKRISAQGDIENALACFAATSRVEHGIRSRETKMEILVDNLERRLGNLPLSSTYWISSDRFPGLTLAGRRRFCKRRRLRAADAFGLSLRTRHASL